MSERHSPEDVKAAQADSAQAVIRERCHRNYEWSGCWRVRCNLGHRCALMPANAFQKGGAPWINRKHIDGPVLCLRDGRLHWLSTWERIQFRLGFTDEWKLESKHWRTAR